MVELAKGEEIKRFLIDNDLTVEQLDEKDEDINAWQKKCQEIVRGFWDYLNNRFMGIERRLSLIEEEKKKR